MAECNIKNQCSFYKRFKNNYAARESFIKIACKNENIPCARRIWQETKGSNAPSNYSPSGTYLTGP